MKKLIFISIILSFNSLCFSSCKEDVSMASQPFLPKDTLILDKNISEQQATELGNELITKQFTISKFEGEIYAHESRLLIVDGIAYCAYYCNDKSSLEGAAGQSIRLAVFNIENPGKRKIYDIFGDNGTHETLILDKNTPCYSPVLFLSEDRKIRILAKVYTARQQKYYYRDFDPISETLTKPQICKITIQDKPDLLDFDINNIRKHLSYSFDSNYDLSTNEMYASSEPIQHNDVYYIGLTIGRFTGNKQTDEGTTLLLRTDNFGQSFTAMGAVDGRVINTKYCRQFVEGAFDWVDENKKNMLLIGRNSLGGIMLSESKDGGYTFSTPYSLNDACGFNTKDSKPILIKHNDGYLTIWNIKEDVGSYNYRTTLEVRYGKELNLCKNPIKLKFKNQFGCHYPSLYRYRENFYLTYTTDSRRFNRNSTGEIVFIKLPF